MPANSRWDLIRRLRVNMTKCNQKNIKMWGGGGRGEADVSDRTTPFALLTVERKQYTYHSGICAATRYSLKCRLSAQNALTSLVQCRSTVSQDLPQIPKSSNELGITTTS